MNRTLLLLSAFMLVSYDSNSLAFETRVSTNAPPQKATAALLIEDAKRALALIGKLAKESTDGSLDLKNVRQQPFWTALKKTDEAILSIESRFKTHDMNFFDSVNASTECAAELRGALPRSGIKNAKVESGVKTLCNALILLRKNYGVEALRKRQGGALSEKEKAAFTKLKEAETTLASQLEDLLAEVKDNAHLTAELNRLIGQLKKSIEAPLTVTEMNAALELVDVVNGEWESYSYYVEPKNRKAWQSASIADSFKAVDAINKESMADINAPDWNYLEESVDISSNSDLTVDIDVNEVDGYVGYIAQSVKGTELEFYYEEVTTDDMREDAFEEMRDE